MNTLKKVLFCFVFNFIRSSGVEVVSNQYDAAALGNVRVTRG